MVVAVACLLSGAALVVMAGGPGSEPARAQRAAQTPSDVTPGHSHGGDLGVPGMNERQLRAFETATLGPAHAREHALMRSAIRADKAAQTEPAVPVQPRASASVAAADAAAVDPPSEVGQWETAKYPFKVVAIHAALLKSGKVMFFSYPTFPERTNTAEAYLWDPANPAAPPVPKTPPNAANIWCAGQTFTADGELVVFGGNLEFPNAQGTNTWKGLNKVYTFNSDTEQWTQQPDMRHGRWYPTGVRMADGRIPIVSGLDELGRLDPFSHTNTDVELFTPPANPGGQGTVKLIGSIGDDPLKPVGQLYPRMVEMASGRTILAGPDRQTTWYFKNVDANPFTWSDIPDLSRDRTWGTTVPLPSGPGGPTKLMALGGTDFSGNPSTTTTEVFDETAWDQSGQGWTAASSNLYGRGHANTVLLPDGSMVEVGGGRGSSAGVDDTFESPLHYAEPEKRQVELWDPVAKTWRLGPAQTESRAYHSVALLLPDGRVMSAGDEYNGDPGDPNKHGAIDTNANEDTAEIYKPPYLFRGPQPSITSAPAEVGLGDTFGVQTPNANIKSASLAGPGAVTHGVDMNQRMLKLNVTQKDGCVSVTAPPTAQAAPPGYYMLFLLNDQGVPSVAKFVRLRAGVNTADCAGGTPTDQAAPAVELTQPTAGTVSGTRDLFATASDDIGVVGVQFKVDGQLIVDDTLSPYTTQWNSRTVGDGNHTITATARDASGKTSMDSVMVNVDNFDTNGPLTGIVRPTTGVTVGGTTAVQAAASDPSGVSQVQFKVDGNNVGPPDTSEPFVIQWATSDVSNGSHTLTAVARDTLGNMTTSAAVGVTVYNAPGTPVDPLPPQRTPPGPPGTTPPGGTPPGGNPSANLAPAIAKLKLSRATFRKGKSTIISFRLSEAARVVLSFERKLAGRRVRGACVKPAKGARPNCTRYARVKTSLTLQGKAGANSLVFRGRLSRTRVLAVGSYRLTLMATDATGKRSSPARASLRLLESAGASRARAARAIVLGWF